jgi:hypothetical protein
MIFSFSDGSLFKHKAENEEWVCASNVTLRNKSLRERRELFVAAAGKAPNSLILRGRWSKAVGAGFERSNPGWLIRDDCEVGKVGIKTAGKTPMGSACA